jgi:hypothetical protein
MIITPCNLVDEYQHFEEVCCLRWITTVQQRRMLIQSLVRSHLAPSVHKLWDEVRCQELLDIWDNEMEIKEP